MMKNSKLRNLDYLSTLDDEDFIDAMIRRRKMAAMLYDLACAQLSTTDDATTGDVKTAELRRKFGCEMFRRSDRLDSETDKLLVERKLFAPRAQLQ